MLTSDRSIALKFKRIFESLIHLKQPGVVSWASHKASTFHKLKFPVMRVTFKCAPSRKASIGNS